MKSTRSSPCCHYMSVYTQLHVHTFKSNSDNDIAARWGSRKYATRVSVSQQLVSFTAALLYVKHSTWTKVESSMYIWVCIFVEQLCTINCQSSTLPVRTLSEHLALCSLPSAKKALFEGDTVKGPPEHEPSKRKSSMEFRFLTASMLLTGPIERLFAECERRCGGGGAACTRLHTFATRDPHLDALDSTVWRIH